MARHIRSIFEDNGHEVHVLARPVNPKMPVKKRVDFEGPWNIPRLSTCSEWEPPASEYVAWARDTEIEVLFCDMNLQFKEIAAVRELGVRTIGRFVWERFSKGHVASALKAYDVIYSLTRAEQARYKEFGINSPYLRWGLPPELVAIEPQRPVDRIDFLFHGGLQGARKPIQTTVDAFKETTSDGIRLILKSQGIRDISERVEIADDPRILSIVEDLPTEQYLKLFANSHVCLCPARWEGLGVHLYEALALGMPVISNDIAPINEVVKHGVSGLLCRSNLLRTKPGNGLHIYEPDKDHLRECIEELSDPERLLELTESTRRYRDSRPWSNTKSDYLAVALGEKVGSPIGVR